MEQILAFVLGVSAALLVWGVVVAFKTASKVKNLEEQSKYLHSEVIERDQLVNRRIDQEIDRVDKIYRECISYTDSRVDKLEQKLTGTSGAKQVLKG